MKMFLACSQVGKFSPCILKIVDNVETSVFRVNFLFFSILYLFPLPFRIHKYDRYFKSNAENDPFQTTVQYFSALEAEKIKSSNKTKLPFIRSLIREKPFTFYVSSFIKLIFLLLLLGIESKIERGDAFSTRYTFFSFFPPRQTHLAAVVADGEKAQVMGKNKLAQREILALFVLTGEREKFRREFANKGKTIYPANGRSIGRLKIFTMFPSRHSPPRGYINGLSSVKVKQNGQETKKADLSDLSTHFRNSE